MRRAIVAALAAAALGVLGLAATAQAQSGIPHAAATTVQKQVVAGIPASILVTNPSGTSETCTVTVSGLPGPATDGTAASVNHGCTVEIEGVWPTKGTDKVTITFTASGKTTTVTLSVIVFPEPCEDDVVGVGSATTLPLMSQLATDWDNTLPPRTKCPSKPSTKPYKYNWGPVNPVTGQIGDSIPVKQDCGPVVRPGDSSAGITQLALFTRSSSGPYCVNFARSGRARAATDPPYGPGGVAFVALAGDAVSWSTPSITDAPKSLTLTQLQAIYKCTDTNWDQVGGKDAPIKPFLPQTSSDIRTFWLAALGLTTPGSCVSDENNTLEENEGVNPVLRTPEAIFPYSVGAWIAQKFHAAECTTSGCTANSSGVVCVKTPNKDQFWCDVHGTMTVKQISGVSPTVGSGTKTTINPAFSPEFDRILYNVVPYDLATADHIPGATSPVGGLDLETEFGHSGFDCSSKTAKADIVAYGYVPLSVCGATS